MLGKLWLFVGETGIGSGNVEESATQILEDGALASETIAEMMDQLWDDVLGGGLYQAIAQLGVLFAVGTLVLFIVQWSRSQIENDITPQAFSEIIWPILVIYLLSNNASTLAEATKGLRQVVNQTNQALLESTTASIRLSEAYSQVMNDSGVSNVLRGQLSQCASLVDPVQQNDCVKRVQEQSQSMSGERSEGFQKWAENLTDPNFILGQINDSIQMAIRGWLIAFSIAFQWIVEISMLLTGLLGPLAVGGSLLPVGQKAIFAWLTGFFSVAMVKICFNIIAGLTATLVLKAGALGSMDFAFAVGILAPALSLILASGGGMAVFNSLSSLGRFGLSQVFYSFRLLK